MQKKVFIKTFGCQMNEYDSDKMADVLGAAIVRRAPYVDMVFGPQTLHRLPQMIAARRGGAANTQRHSLAMVGSVQRILVEGPAKKDPGDLQGRSENNRVVNFAGGADAPRLVGQLVDVRTTASHSYTLRGELVAATSETKRAS